MFLSAFRYTFVICTYRCPFHFDKSGAPPLYSTLPNRVRSYVFSITLPNIENTDSDREDSYPLLLTSFSYRGMPPVFHDHLWAYVRCSIEFDYSFFVS